MLPDYDTRDAELSSRKPKAFLLVFLIVVANVTVKVHRPKTMPFVSLYSIQSNQLNKTINKRNSFLHDRNLINFYYKGRTHNSVISGATGEVEPITRLRFFFY